MKDLTGEYMVWRHKSGVPRPFIVLVTAKMSQGDYQYIVEHIEDSLIDFPVYEHELTP